MEQVQIHSKSYIVRWINVSAGHSISWSLQPHKKSLNIGIFKHPGIKAGSSPNIPSSGVFDPDAFATPISEQQDGERRKRGSVSRHQPTNVVEKLESIGLKCVEWIGKCDADKVSTGKYDVQEETGGTYVLVLDNTFSKQVSKTATFVLMTHPTAAPPKSGSFSWFVQDHETGSVTNPSQDSPSVRAISESTESLPTDLSNPVPALKLPKQGVSIRFGTNFYTGILYKKRRKKNQGYAKRFFSLDFTSSTLSYYRNNHSSALRGAVPLSLAAIGINEKSKEFSVDSGAEVWHLRVKNKKDFEAWRGALQRASESPIAAPSPAIQNSSVASVYGRADPAADRDWARVEELVGRVSGSRDAVRRLAQDTDPKYAAMANGGGSPTSIPDESSYFPDTENKSLPFWKRKTSTSSQGGSPSGMFRRSVSVLVAPTQTNQLALSPPLPPMRRKSSMPFQAPQSHADDIHDRCMALLRDLDTTVAEFSSLIAENKTRRRPAHTRSASKMTIDSVDDDDFYDAEDHLEQSQSHMLMIPSDESPNGKDNQFEFDDDSETSSDAGDRAPSGYSKTTKTELPTGLFAIAPAELVPKSVPIIQSRPNVPPPRQPPPSIIGFLRKNAGKDLSTVSMPVSANEPTSLLQRLAEPLEAAHLLSSAASATSSISDGVIDRLVQVSAFAIASFSSNRVKERALRKPFNPMLGETFELVRHEDPSSASSPSYRFLAEKVSHHPVIMAYQADSLTGSWSLSQSPQPVQKFWGKSVELNTEGKWRLILHAVGGERYSWTAATCFLRNVLAGEKYVEPVSTMTITNETTGHTAVATFKAAGMFSGRSEDVSISFYELGSSAPLSITLSGKWTTGLTRSDTGAEVWSPGPLTDQGTKGYGFPIFSAGLNEITMMEKGKLPCTDSRLRPDQQALEEGDLDKAEALKARLEERQRARRKLLESHGREYKATFFEEVEEGEEKVWRLKSGGQGYWARRERGSWQDIGEVFEI